MIIVQVFCFCCLLGAFFFKFTNRSFWSRKKHSASQTVISCYFKSGRMILDLGVMALLTVTTSMRDITIVSGVLFIILILTLIVSLEDLIKIEAAYFKSKRQLLTWGLCKVLFQNILVAHIIAGFVLAMSRLDL